MIEKAVILVVDDEPTNIDVVSDIFMEQYDLRVAHNGERALKALQRITVDLILLDVQMPQIDGYETARRIRDDAALAGVPIIFLTGKADDDSIVQGFRAGGNDYVTKPFNPEELKVRVANHIRTARLQKSLEALNRELTERVEAEVAQRMQVVRESREKELMLIQQSKMASMGEMIGVIAHQWKQPLNALAVLTEGIAFLQQAGKLDNTRAQDFADRARTLIDQMVTTIDDFSNFFKPSKQRIHFRACESVEEIIRMFAGQFEKQNIKAVVHPHEHFSVHGYPNEFKQVILNLLNNAREAILEQGVAGQIDCFFELSPQTGTIRIRDNGGGIPGEMLPQKVFEPYFTTKTKGSGIGLQISKTIIEKNMQGRLWAHNVEGGAEFVVELPLSKE